MMRCEEAESLLGELTFGDLDAERTAELRAHIEKCPACRELAGDMKVAAKLLKDGVELETPVLSDDAKAELVQRASGSPQRRFLKVGGVVGGIAVAAMLFLGVSVLFVAAKPGTELMMTIGDAEGPSRPVCAQPPRSPAAGPREGASYVPRHLRSATRQKDAAGRVPRATREEEKRPVRPTMGIGVDVDRAAVRTATSSLQRQRNMDPDTARGQEDAVGDAPLEGEGGGGLGVMRLRGREAKNSLERSKRNVKELVPREPVVIHDEVEELDHMETATAVPAERAELAVAERQADAVIGDDLAEATTPGGDVWMWSPSAEHFTPTPKPEKPQGAVADRKAAARERLAQIASGMKKPVEPAEAMSKRRETIDALVANASKAMNGRDYDDVIVKADEVLRADPGAPEAVELKAKAEAAKTVAAGPDHRMAYDKLSKQIDKAKGDRDWDGALRLTRKLEEFVPAGGPSRQGEVSEIEAEKLVTRGAVTEARARDLSGLREAKKQYEGALKKKDAPKIRQRLAGVQKKIAAIEAETASTKRAEQAIMRAEQLDRADELASALQLLRTAGREAHTNPALQRRIRQMMVRINTELGNRTSIDAGDQAMARGDRKRAVSEYRKAQRIKDTPGIRAKIAEAEAVVAEADGQAALESGDMARAIEKFQTAVQLRPTPEITSKLEDVKARKARKEYLAEVEKAKTARGRKQFRSVAAGLKALSEKYPDWAEAKEVLKEGALPEEKKMIDAAALKQWQRLQNQLKKSGANASRKVAVMEAALPALAGSSYESMAERVLMAEKDKLARAKFTKLTSDITKMKTARSKLASMEAALPMFEGTSFEGQIKDAIRRE